MTLQSAKILIIVRMDGQRSFRSARAILNRCSNDKNMIIDNKTIFIIGPTAVGKTELAINLASAYGSEIISADSMQIYRSLDIGTAKPSKEQLSRVPHHMIDIVEPTDSFTVADYKAMAEEITITLRENGIRPMIVGGTGLYINSLIYNMDFSGSGRIDGFREEYEELAEVHGNQYIYDILISKDPMAADKVHPNNRKRIIRALERVEFGREEEGLTEFKNSFEANPLYEPIIFLLTREREELIKRIDLRVDQIIEAGLENEVKSLVDSGLSSSDISMLGIGYKEIIGYLSEEYDFDEAVRLIKRNTRRYAKRQMTWFRRYENAHRIDLSTSRNFDIALNEIIEIADANGISLN